MQTVPVAETCLLLHGWGFDASVMAPLKRVLEQDRTAMACDIPGITTTGKGANNLQAITSELAEYPASTGTLIGWSLGGNIAIQIASHLSGRIAALVLICCNPSFVLRPRWPCALDPGAIVGLQSVLAEDRDRAAVEFAGWCALGERSVRTVRRTLTDNMASARTSRHSLDLGLRLLQHLDQRMLLAELDCPVLMLFAENDCLVPVAAADCSERLSGNITVRVIRDCGHALPVSLPGRTAEEIRRFTRAVSR